MRHKIKPGDVLRVNERGELVRVEPDANTQRLLGFIRAALYSGQKSNAKARAQDAFEQLVVKLSAGAPERVEPQDAQIDGVTYPNR